MPAISNGAARMSEWSGTPETASILQQRDRILSSDGFVSSPRMRDFLEFLVAETVAGRADRLKEMAIGLSVFDRDESFDPRVDSIVRVEAGRLRSKLRDYYAESGSGDPIIISVPKGGYTPHFEQRNADANPFELSVVRTSDSRGLDVRRRRLKKAHLAYAGAALGLMVAAAFLQTSANRQAPADALSGPRTVAVLPLREYSASSPDYFAEATTDVLVARLSEQPDLRVTSLASVLRFQDSPLTPTEIARQLGVSSIVTGSVYRDSEQLRITANLIDAASGRNLWSKTSTRPMSDALLLQDDIAAEISTELGARLSPSPQERNTISASAYDAYLKGVYWRNRPTAQGFNRGIHFFQEAIAHQPDYAEAYAGLAACHCQLGGHGLEVVAPEAALPEARRLANRALELDSGLAAPSAVQGIIRFKYDWDPIGAEADLQRALQRNPSLFEAQLWLSQVAEGTGRKQTALRHARAAAELNPLSLAATLNLAWQSFQAGLIDEAEAGFANLVSFEPEFWGGHWGLGHVLRERGNLDASIAAFEAAVELGGGHTLPVAALGHAYAVAGNQDAATAILDELLATTDRTYVSPVHVALVYAGLGDTDNAFEWLQRGFDVRARAMAWLSVTREFDVLQQDPRYGALLAAIGIRSGQ